MMNEERTVTITRRELETLVGLAQGRRDELWNDGRPAPGYKPLNELVRSLARQHPDCTPCHAQPID